MCSRVRPRAKSMSMSSEVVRLWRETKWDLVATDWMSVFQLTHTKKKKKYIENTQEKCGRQQWKQYDGKKPENTAPAHQLSMRTMAHVWYRRKNTEASSIAKIRGITNALYFDTASSQQQQSNTRKPCVNDEKWTDNCNGEGCKGAGRKKRGARKSDLATEGIENSERSERSE